ncbi:WD40-repeat-containing domain protein [Zychaea mexicana]|uniref:WD40-repeat-containing domain protein n=1 Tax=Zychaea mexicana TaxID=64656 RepID=UPI0022FDFF46|nr:WD40-repeat-containing domain protein [Zychaea mexicana]KAI9498974.1 WD40-repeat-containing domain protein [Zychaea mexicana]
MTKRKYSDDEAVSLEHYRNHTDPRTWSVHKALRMRAMHGRRYNGHPINIPGRQLLERFTCQDKDIYRFYYPNGQKCTPFVCAYSHYRPILAVGDEERRVALIQTAKDNTVESARFHKAFYTHTDAVLDVKWSNDDQLLLTASGDAIIRLWDVEHQTCVATLKGHKHSIRSVNFHPSNPHLMISASKDGAFCIWDTRYRLLQQNDPDVQDGIGEDAPVYGPIKTTPYAHDDPKSQRKARSGKIAATAAGGYSRVMPDRSVTCALFVPHHETKIVSSGSYDGKIKIWDCRAGRDAHAIDEWGAYDDSLARVRGITDMKIDSTGTRLYSLSVDHRINMHYLNNLTQPARRFVNSNQKLHTFYVKMSLSADDRYLLCGSTNKSVYAWDVERPQSGPVLFDGHEGETTSMSWCSNTSEVSKNDGFLGKP